MLFYWAALLISFTVTAFGQVTYKHFSKSQNKRYLILSVTLFAIVPFTSYIALQRFHIGMVYIGAAFSQILVLFLSRQLLHERLSKNHFISMGLILLGLIVYALGS